MKCVPTAVEILSSELHDSYVRGYKDGASHRRARREFTEHETRSDLAKAYSDGYGAGWRAQQRAAARAARKFNYRPNILRLQQSLGDR